MSRAFVRLIIQIKEIKSLFNYVSYKKWLFIARGGVTHHKGRSLFDFVQLLYCLVYDTSEVRKGGNFCSEFFIAPVFFCVTKWYVRLVHPRPRINDVSWLLVVLEGCCVRSCLPCQGCKIIFLCFFFFQGAGQKILTL